MVLSHFYSLNFLYFGVVMLRSHSKDILNHDQFSNQMPSLGFELVLSRAGLAFTFVLVSDPACALSLARLINGLVWDIVQSISSSSSLWLTCFIGLVLALVLIPGPQTVLVSCLPLRAHVSCLFLLNVQ